MAGDGKRSSISKIRTRYRIAFILLEAFLTVILLAELAKLPELSIDEKRYVKLEESNGIYDLTNRTEGDTAIFRLAPAKIYYPGSYLTPTTVDEIPAQGTDSYGKQRIDYLSQRFMIKLPDNKSIYTLTFTLSGRHALRVFVNGRMAGQTGKLGTTKQGSEVWENNITVAATPEHGIMDIIINSAQFYHSKRGATLAALNIYQTGGTGDIFLPERIKGLVVMGALLCAAAIQLGSYLLLSPTKFTLYFSLACVVMALRECLQSQAWIYFPLSGNLSFLLEYMTVVLLTIFLSLYLGQYATNKFLKCAQQVALAGSLMYGLCVLFSDSLFYTSMLSYYQLLLILCIVPGITGLFYTMRHPNKEQTAALYGIAVFYIAAVADIMMYSDIFGDSRNIPIAEAAMLVFVLAQSFSLFLMNNRVVTEAREAKQKLFLEQKALREIDRMKTEFLGNVSHELKTPLTVISCHAQMVKQSAEREEVLDKKKLIHKMKLISSEGERLSLMVGQILDVTRLEEGRLTFDIAPCHLEEVIYSAVEAHYPLLDKNKNRLEIRLSPSLPMVAADSIRISQVIINLIANATRFTSNGLIKITAEERLSEVIVCVSDTGAGIEPERLPHIFERYNNHQKSGNDKATGTGLGLYICKYIMEQHHGRIWVESEKEKGTAVFFSLQAASQK